MKIYYLCDTFTFFFFFFCTAQHVGPHFPDQGLNPGSLQWKLGVSTTGPPGKPPFVILGVSQTQPSVPRWAVMDLRYYN